MPSFCDGASGFGTRLCNALSGDINRQNCSISCEQVVFLVRYSQKNHLKIVIICNSCSVRNVSQLTVDNS